jgi:hypothetical protein
MNRSRVQHERQRASARRWFLGRPESDGQMVTIVSPMVLHDDHRDLEGRHVSPVVA